MKREKGQAIILALIVLAVGSLVIVPTLNYASTGLKAYQVTRDLMTEQYAADAAVEDAIWRLQNNIDGFTGSLTVDTPTQNYSLTVNDMEVSVTVDLPQPPPSAEPIPPQQSGHWIFAYGERTPRWIRIGTATTFSVNVVNHGTSTESVHKIYAWLPPGFVYVDGSTTAGSLIPRDPDVLELLVDGRWKLTWEVIEPPYPKVNSGSTEIQYFNATAANTDGGIYYAEFSVLSTAVGGDVGTPTHPCAPVWVSMYDITATAGKVTVEACVALTQSGGITVFNWQEQ